ncbi:MAG: hypothetical protein GY751_21090 [Bacteroidetes bacterium]|nr:hypothetical protein [Bacteroidota bacterium]
MFHGDDIPSNYFLLEWYGLYVDGRESELSKVEVEFRPAFDPLLDMLGEMTARNVVVTNDTLQPLLLISGVEAHAGSLPFVELTNEEGTVLSLPQILEPGHDLFLEEGLDSKYNLKVHGEGNNDHAIELIRQGELRKQQVFAGAKELDDARMDVRWVGDLNGDSKPDFLLNIASKYSYSHWALFLSGNEDGRLLHPAADLLFTSC